MWCFCYLIMIIPLVTLVQPSLPILLWDYFKVLKVLKYVIILCLLVLFNCCTHSNYNWDCFYSCLRLKERPPIVDQSRHSLVNTDSHCWVRWWYDGVYTVLEGNMTLWMVTRPNLCCFKILCLNNIILFLLIFWTFAKSTL